MDLIKLSDEIGLDITISKALKPAQLGWLQLAANKKAVSDELNKFSLGIQADVKSATESTELTNIQLNLKSAKQKLAEMVDCRKRFTNTIQQKIVEPLMQFEKDCDELIKPVIQKELEARIEINKKADEAAALQREIAAFKAHIQNEYNRIGGAYRAALREAIVRSYVTALENNFPVEQIPETKEELKQILQSIKPLAFNKFERKLIPDEKAKEVFASIPRYIPAVDYAEAVSTIDKEFLTYELDVQNATSAAQAALKQAQEETESDLEDVKLQNDTNIMVAQSEALVMTGAPKVKRTFVVPVVESYEWEIAILGIMFNNFNQLRPYIKSGSGKMSLGQIATAIGKLATDTDEKFGNIKYEIKAK